MTPSENALVCGLSRHDFRTESYTILAGTRRVRHCVRLIHIKTDIRAVGRAYRARRLNFRDAKTQMELLLSPWVEAKRRRFV